MDCIHAIQITGTDFDGFEQANDSTVEIPVALGSDVALECDVLDANPPPQIKWWNDQEEIQEMRESNSVRFLDGGRYLYVRNLQAVHLDRHYHCIITNANLSMEISAPTRYVLVDNLSQGVLIDYKQIGDLRAFVGNMSFEFAYVGGVVGINTNQTFNRFYFNDDEVFVRGNIGRIRTIFSPGFFILRANIGYNGMFEIKSGTLAVYRELNNE